MLLFFSYTCKICPINIVITNVQIVNPPVNLREGQYKKHPKIISFGLQAVLQRELAYQQHYPYRVLKQAQ